MNKFEQLIEYVINDEEAKAKELFHDIVVEKSRQIYENLMAEEAEEDLDESAEEDLDESAEEDLDESAEEDLDESAEEDLDEGLMDEVEAEEESDMNMEDDDSMGGDASDEFISDVEVDDNKESGEAATKDDIMNLEDKLDQLMAEFEDLMGNSQGGDGDGFGPEEGGDAIEMDDTEEMEGMMEAVTLKAAPKPVTSEEGSVNKRGSNNNNGGANSPISKSVKPVHIGQGDQDMGKHDAAGAYSNQTKELIGQNGTTPAQTKGQQLKPATKPTLSQASGVNTKSPVARG
jgi:hypothetical protein